MKNRPWFQEIAERIFVDPAGITSDRFEWQQKLSGEQKLMAAILEDALRNLKRIIKSVKEKRRKLTKHNQRLWVKDLHWFFAQDTERIHSFINVCDELKLNPGCIRNKVQEWYDDMEILLKRKAA